MHFVYLVVLALVSESQLRQRSHYGHPPLSPTYSADTCSVASFQDTSSVFGDPKFIPESPKVSSLETTTTVLSDSSSDRLQLVDRDLVYQLYDFPATESTVERQNNLNLGTYKDATFLRAHCVGNAATHRRYSCGDLNFNIKTEDWPDKAKLNGSLDLLLDNRRAVDIAELDDLQTSWLNRLNSIGDHRTKCLAEVERNIQTLSPKLQKCESLKKLGSGSNSSSNSMQCLFESHGNPKESHSSKMGDLLEEILKVCEEFKSSSGSSTSNCSSTKDLTENTPSVSCDIGSKSLSVCGCMRVQSSPASPTSPSWAPSMQSQGVISSIKPRGDPCQCASPRARPPPATQTTQPLATEEFDPCKPLQFVDLQKFDGEQDEGYLYWLRKVPGSNTPVCEPVRTTHGYENIPIGRNSAFRNAVKAGCSDMEVSSVPGTHSQSVGGLLPPPPPRLHQSRSFPQCSVMSVLSQPSSLCGATATPACMSASATTTATGRSASAQQESSDGTYITLRNDSHDADSIRRRNSVDNYSVMQHGLRLCMQMKFPLRMHHRHLC